MEKQALQFKKNMFALMKTARAHFEQELKKSKLDLTGLQCAVLAHMDKDGTTLSDISETLCNKPPTLMPAIDQLEKDGYLRRQPDLHDRRKVRLTLTTKGMLVKKKLSARGPLQIIKKGFTKLGKEKTDVLLSLLEELNGHINN